MTRLIRTCDPQAISPHKPRPLFSLFFFSLSHSFSLCRNPVFQLSGSQKRRQQNSLHVATKTSERAALNNRSGMPHEAPPRHRSSADYVTGTKVRLYPELFRRSPRRHICVDISGRAAGRARGISSMLVFLRCGPAEDMPVRRSNMRPRCQGLRGPHWWYA